MPQIPLVSQARHITTIGYDLTFTRINDPYSGLSFPCGKGGALKWHEMSEAARENFRRALAGVGTEFRAPTVEKWSNTYFQPAIRRCRCGQEIDMQHPRGGSGYGIACPECGTEYSGDGYRLDPVRYIGDSDVPLSGHYE